MPKDKSGKEFEAGQRVHVTAEKPTPWGGSPAGEYDGTVVGVHEDGPHVELDDEEKTRRAPWAAECEILDPVA